MRRQTPIVHLVYNYLFPHPSPNDPPNFSAHLARNLVPEVRIEVSTFYGDLSSTEAKYPGLNYCYPAHRMRLGRFKHHKRLFEAFDNLGLTYNEIQDFCCWEGTRWARERYEKDEGVKVLDTTGDEIKPWVDRERRWDRDEGRRQNIIRKTDISVIVEEAPPTSSMAAGAAGAESEDAEMSDADANAADTDGEQEPASEAAAREQHVAELRRRAEQSINQRIITAWEQGHSLTPEIEQLIKEQTEQGGSVTSEQDLRRLMAVSRAAAARIYLSPNASAVSATRTPHSRAAA